MKYERQSQQSVHGAARLLKRAALHIEQAAKQMKLHGMTDAYFPWTKHQWDCLKLLTELGDRCSSVLALQIIAKVENRPSCFDLIKEKSAKDIAARKLRNGEVPPKPRGRPRKVAVPS